MAQKRMSELNGTLTEDERREIEEAAQRQPVFDEDSPAMTPEMLSQFKRVHQEERKKQTVSLRLSPSTLKKAKMYGKGYTSFLSRLLDEAIMDDDLVRRCI